MAGTKSIFLNGIEANDISFETYMAAELAASLDGLMDCLGHPTSTQLAEDWNSGVQVNYVDNPSADVLAQFDRMVPA